LREFKWLQYKIIQAEHIRSKTDPLCTEAIAHIGILLKKREDKYLKWKNVHKDAAGVLEFYFYPHMIGGGRIADFQVWTTRSWRRSQKYESKKGERRRGGRGNAN
jgi:hypothetical protein